MRTAIVLLALLTASCASAPPRPSSVVRSVGIPAQADYVCLVNADGSANCRAAEEVRAFIRSANALP